MLAQFSEDRVELSAMGFFRVRFHMLPTVSSLVKSVTNGRYGILSLFLLITFRFMERCLLTLSFYCKADWLQTINRPQLINY